MFDYDKAFQRNLGIVSKKEREILRNARIAILGVGGVGGRCAESLTRLGCERLLITDNALFDPPDLNRQFSSTSKTMDMHKEEVVGKVIREINPNIELIVISGGVTDENFKEIVDQSDLIIDEIDVNFGAIKRKVNQYAYQKGKSVISSYLVGHGAICFLFDPKVGCSFDDYFGLEGDLNQEQFFEKFALGVYPNPTSDPCYTEAIKRLLKGEGHIPSSTANSYLAGSLVTMATRSILLGHPKVPVAPGYQQIDLYDMKYHVNFADS